MKDAIQVRGLKKSYGNKMVLRGLDFQIEKGEVFALLGVNGAGKTTTLECIEGLRKYDSGTIMVNGKMGIQLQSSSLPSHIKPMEAVKLFAKWNNTEIDYDMLNALGIREIEKSQYIQLSTGQKRRLHLALALIGNPDIIFLDEPTAGLDVEGRLSLQKWTTYVSQFNFSWEKCYLYLISFDCKIKSEMNYQMNKVTKYVKDSRYRKKTSILTSLVFDYINR